MAIIITDSKTATKYKKIVVYGKSGVGKTKLCSTLPNPLIISSEKKSESLSEYTIPIWTVETIEDYEQAIKDSLGKKGKGYEICHDSISDICETSLSHELPNHKDPRKAHGVIQSKMEDLYRLIRDSDKRHIYIIAKQKMYQNDDGFDTYGPKMTGANLGPNLPYFFDYVFAMRVSDAKKKEKSFRYLQTSIEYDEKFDCKDSSGKLDEIEKPDLAYIIDKISKKSKNK